MAGIHPFVDTVAAQTVQLSRKVSGLFQSCFRIPEISSHAPLACSWSAPTATSAAKWMCYKIPAVLLNCCHRKPESAELLLNIPNLGPLKNELSYFKPIAPKKVTGIQTSSPISDLNCNQLSASAIYELSQHCPRTFVAASDTSLVAGGHGPNACTTLYNKNPNNQHTINRIQ